MAEEASRLKDEFLATLSHEIRTPLNAVIGWTRILQTQPSVRSRAHALEVIERNAMSQMRLVEDLLDMARIISGKLRLKIDTVSLADVAQAAVDVVAPGRGGQEDRDRDRVCRRRCRCVSGDSERLQQVVWNLLSNALKFTETGGRVRARDRVGRRRTCACRCATTARGSRPISARTCSIASARRTRRRAAGTAGSASGLSLVRQIVELHGGSGRRRERRREAGFDVLGESARRRRSRTGVRRFIRCRASRSRSTASRS